MSTKPRPYKPDLTPAPSHLRPHCLARHRLILWIPNASSPRISSPDRGPPLSESDLERVLQVIGSALTESTRELYGTGLLVFHVYCDSKDIPDEQRAPISPNLLATFLANCAGAYSGSTISNYATGLRAWHILHGMEWKISEAEYRALLEGAARLAPSSSKRPKRNPFTLEILERFHLCMDLNDPRDAAIFACLVCSFFSIARLGEFTVPAIAKFNPSLHITRHNVDFTQNHKNLPVIKFFLPTTKTAQGGESVHCAPHPNASPTDPKRALDNHFALNPAEPTAHLFAWKHPSGSLRPLSKKEVTKRIDAIIKSQPGLPDLKGHSLRIGGTLFYLLKGVPFDVVKTMGRWSSESFTIYLRHHALVLAPFLQNKPDILDGLRRYILLPVR